MIDGWKEVRGTRPESGLVEEGKGVAWVMLGCRGDRTTEKVREGEGGVRRKNLK